MLPGVCGRAGCCAVCCAARASTRRAPTVATGTRYRRSDQVYHVHHVRFGLVAPRQTKQIGNSEKNKLYRNFYIMHIL